MADQIVTFYYPKTGTLNVDVTKFGTTHSIPSINFYIKKATIKEADGVEVHMASDHNNYFYQDINDLMTNDEEWYHISLPIGDYYATKEEPIGAGRLWSSNTAGSIGYIYVDDLRFHGIVTRSAYDSIKIGTQKCKMLVVRDDVAKGDTLDSSDDTGQIAQFAIAELARAISTPITGQIVIPLQETIQAGQECHIHFGKQSGGTYRVDDDFRIIEARHVFEANALTYLTLTDDLKNSQPLQPTDAYKAVVEASKIYFQDRTRASILSDLVDVEQTILATDYDTSGWF